MVPSLENGTTHGMDSGPTGDLNNISAMRATEKPIRDPRYAYLSLGVPAKSEESDFRQRYRPFLLEDTVQSSDWISRLELATVTKMVEEDIEKTEQRLRVLVLYGSMRTR